MTNPSPMPEYLTCPPKPYEATHCAWCGLYTSAPVSVRLNFGRTARICGKCSAYDDGPGERPDGQEG